MTQAPSRRYYVRSPDASAMTGFDTLAAGELAAREYGEGTLIIDTLAQAYKPMLHQVRGGEVVYAGYGGWDTGRFGPDRDLIEAIKKGHVAIVHAFLIKGADVNAVDATGGPALHWAVGGGKAEIVQFLLDQGAAIDTLDSHGQTALDLARKKGRTEIIELLEK